MLMHRITTLGHIVSSTSLKRTFEDWLRDDKDKEKEYDKIFDNPESEEEKLREQRSQFQRDGINMIKGNMSSLMVRRWNFTSYSIITFPGVYEWT